MSKIVIVGASGHALVVVDIIEKLAAYEVVGFVDDLNPQKHGKEFCGSSVLGGLAELESLLLGGVEDAFVAIGDCNARRRIAQQVRAAGFRIPSLVHPHACVARGVQLGTGTVVMAGAVINPGCSIGDDVIVNTGATIDHECIVRDGVHLSPGVHLAGRVQIDSGTWLGIGAVVKDQIVIGKNTVVGAGSVVVSSLPDNCTAFGVPAKIRDIKSLPA